MIQAHSSVVQMGMQEWFLTGKAWGLLQAPEIIASYASGGTQLLMHDCNTELWFGWTSWRRQYSPDLSQFHKDNIWGDLYFCTITVEIMSVVRNRLAASS